MDIKEVVQAIGNGYVWLAANLGPTFVADVLKTLLGTFVGAGLAFYFAIRKDDLNRLREQKAAGNMATLTLVQLANDFLLAKTDLLEFQKYLNRVQPHSPVWMQFKPMHFTFADVKFDLPSLIFLLEYEGGSDVVEKLITVQMKVHNFFGQLSEHGEAHYAVQEKASAAGLDSTRGASLGEIKKAAGEALIARVESFVGGINMHLANTEPSIRSAVAAMPALMIKIFGSKGVTKVQLPTHDELVKLLQISYPEK